MNRLKVVEEPPKMLNPFIIDQIKRREQEKAKRDQERYLELELPIYVPEAPYRYTEPDEDPEPGERGVVIIDLL
jgi:hypothetical protein